MLDDASEARLEAGDREEVFSGGRETLDEPDPEADKHHGEASEPEDREQMHG